MTPLNPHSNAPRSTASSTLIIGIALVISCIGSGGMFGLYRVLAAKERAGWNLVPIVVAAVDVEEGTVLDMSMISQRSIPEQFANAAIVKPDSASYIVNVRVRRALQAGDPVRWTDMVDEKGQRHVLVAKVQLEPGTTVDANSTEVIALDEADLTASWVQESDLPQLAKRKVTVPMRAGDPVLWTHFAAPGDTR